MSNNGSTDHADSDDAYFQLGLRPGATFEEIQKARDIKLDQAGDDLILKAKIESSYDLLLMNSLKERRLGNVSNDAASASQREQNANNFNASQLGSSLITRLRDLNPSSKNSQGYENDTSLIFPQGEGLYIRISIGILALLILLVSPDSSIQLILSISTIAVFFSQIKRGRKVFQALGWSVVFLSSGYILGGIIVSSIGPITDHSLVISLNKLEALPAILLLWIGSFI